MNSIPAADHISNNPDARGITIHHVTKRYSGQPAAAVDNINLTFEGGAINGLLGPNGAGKTTLILMICGLMPPDKGQIGRMKNGILQNLDKRKIGFVPQQDGLFGELTLQENLEYFGGLYCLSRKELKTNIERLSSYLQLSNHLGKKIKYFSGGMNRRANILASLLHDPEDIIFDEPTAGVDVQSRALIHRLIMDLKEAGKTILYTSHLLAEAEELCTEIYIMDHGKLILSGKPKNLLRQHGKAGLDELFLSLTGKQVRD